MQTMQLNNVVTIDRHIVEMEKKFPSATGEFSKLLYNISLAAKLITRDVRKAGLVDILGITGTSNSTGDVQKKLDVFSHDVMVNSLNHDGNVCVLGSEESDELIPMEDSAKKGKYVVLFDPLDGSSNIDANVSIGTIFSIFKRVTPVGTSGNLKDVLQPGYKQMAAGYVLYGSSTMFVYSTGYGVHGFTYDPSIGEFLLSHPNIKTPRKGKIYSINEGNWHSFDDSTKRIVNYLREEDKATGRPYTTRYIGSLVADFHRNLLYGGIYMYPGSKKAPNGKLRLLYENSPLAFIVEQAGGKATDGKVRILDIVPTELHQRTPLYIGSPDDVDLAMKFIKESQEVPVHG